MLDNAALDLYLRFLPTSNMDDLNFAIYGWQEALKLPAPSPEFGADYRLNLGSMLRLGFAANGNSVDLERAIRHFRDAMSMTRPSRLATTTGSAEDSDVQCCNPSRHASSSRFHRCRRSQYEGGIVAPLQFGWRTGRAILRLDAQINNF